VSALIEAGGRIGPNAILQPLAVLRDRLGRGEAGDLFTRAGLSRYLEVPPHRMVPEAEVIRLHQTLRTSLGPDRAAALMHESGRRTADYLLAHRIPRPVQWLLKHLPAPLASRVLLSAIARHAWTFAGSGRFTIIRAAPALVAIQHGPFSQGVTGHRSACDFYTGTFERLYGVLVHPRAVAEETDCEATGAPRCLFRIVWR